MLHTLQEARAQNYYCSDVRTSKILGHLGLIVDVIHAQGRKSYKICMTQTHTSEGNLPLEGAFFFPERNSMQVASTSPVDAHGRQAVYVHCATRTNLNPPDIHGSMFFAF